MKNPLTGRGMLSPTRVAYSTGFRLMPDLFEKGVRCTSDQRTYYETDNLNHRGTPPSLQNYTLHPR